MRHPLTTRHVVPDPVTTYPPVGSAAATTLVRLPAPARVRAAPACTRNLAGWLAVAAGTFGTVAAVVTTVVAVFTARGAVGTTGVALTVVLVTAVVMVVVVAGDTRTAPRVLTAA